MKNERNIFEVATREVYRFPFKGNINVEDLWHLSTNDLDIIFKTLNSQLKQVKEESLLETKTKKDEELDTKIEIVKYIFNIKSEEAKLILKTKEQKEQKQKILEILSTKQDNALQNKSEEELQKMLIELGN